ncbi:MAG: ArsA-related P-loop ATPase [Solirubrobacteraceae bacterium]
MPLGAFTGPPQRLLVVTGKGGVGKSTVAAAVAVAATRRGLRTIVAEVSGRADVARLLGGRGAAPLRESEPCPGLHHVTIDRRSALEQYLRDEVPGPLPAGLLARSRAFELFVAAAPGMSDLLTVGKVWELAQRPRHQRGARPYDLVVLDAPASGNLVGLLGAARTFTAVARVGPVARQGAAIDRALTDPAFTGVIAVATPEQMPVTETLTLRRALVEQLGIGLRAVVVNRLVRSPFTDGQLVAMHAVDDDPAVRSARWLHGRAREHRTQLGRLRRGLQARAVAELAVIATPPSTATLPFVFAREIGRREVEQLADRLDRLLT